MPELNLNALKDRKRTTQKFRPYDIPAPDSSNMNDLKSDIMLKEKEAVSISKSNSPSQNLSAENFKKEIAAKLEAEIEKKYKLKLEASKLEWQNKESRDSNKSNSIPSIVTTASSKTFFKLSDQKISNEALLIIIKKLSQWNEPSLKLFTFLLEKTENGQLKDVQLGRKEIESEVIHGRYFKEARDHLSSEGIISFRNGYIGTTKKQGTFYSINTQNVFLK